MRPTLNSTGPPPLWTITHTSVSLCEYPSSIRRVGGLRCSRGGLPPHQCRRGAGVGRGFLPRISCLRMSHVSYLGHTNVLHAVAKLELPRFPVSLRTRKGAVEGARGLHGRARLNRLSTINTRTSLNQCFQRLGDRSVTCSRWRGITTPSRPLFYLLSICIRIPRTRPRARQPWESRSPRHPRDKETHRCVLPQALCSDPEEEVVVFEKCHTRS